MIERSEPAFELQQKTDQSKGCGNQEASGQPRVRKASANVEEIRGVEEGSAEICGGHAFRFM